jgi:hypothetical protein
MYGSDAGVSFAPYGRPVFAGGDRHELPLSLGIGAWLFDRIGSALDRRYVGVSPHASPAECVALGRQIVDGPARIALIVMADGSARRTSQSPGPYDPRAEPYDRHVVDALATGRADLLRDLDADLARELMVDGRAAWQVLAGAALTVNGPLDAHVLRAEAPYGVGYVVAVWRPTEQQRTVNQLDAED